MTNDLQLVIRRATQGDSEDLWRWRNDPQTKAMSKNIEEVSWDAHERWYVKSLKDPVLFIFIGLTQENEKVGMSRFNLSKDIAEVSINLNPIFRQKGFSTPLLVASIHQFYKYNKNALIATIKRSNKPSIKCFENAGFTFDSEDADYCYYKYEK